MLLASGDSPIIEWNNWNDKDWGASITDNKGKNALGLILMDIRTLIQEEIKTSSKHI